MQTHPAGWTRGQNPSPSLNLSSFHAGLTPLPEAADDEQLGVPEPRKHRAAPAVGCKEDVLGGWAVVVLGVDGAGLFAMPCVGIGGPHLDGKRTPACDKQSP